MGSRTALNLHSPTGSSGSLLWFVLNNSATNLRVLAWLTGGESLHNNHHAYPSSPKFSMGRFEFDPSWVVIRVLMLLRLVRLVGDKVKLAA